MQFQPHVIVAIIFFWVFGAGIALTWGLYVLLVVRYHLLEKAYKASRDLWNAKKELFVATAKEKYIAANMPSARGGYVYDNFDPYAAERLYRGNAPFEEGKRVDEPEISGWVALWTTVLGIIMIVIGVALMAPFNGYYYHFYTKTGVVETVKRNDNLGDFVIKISGYKHPIYVDDARLLYLKGTTQSFFCTPNYQYDAQPYMTCTISTNE